MCKPNPRRVTAQEREEDTYLVLYGQVEANEKAEYMRSFGPTYREKYPFKADGPKIHGIVEKLMRSSWLD